MYESNVKASDLISDLKNEIDIAVPISDKSYVDWLNAIERFLYTEIIKEQKEHIVQNPKSSPITLSELVLDDGGDKMRFEDIYTVYSDDIQLIKSTLTTGKILKDTWYKENNNLGFNCFVPPTTMKIIYYVKPKLKTAETDDTIKIPIEFLDLVKAKIRGEAYKVANEDNLAAKWLNDYNVLLENFKQWIITKSSNFGM